MWDVLKAALPYAEALIKFVSLAFRTRDESLTKEEVYAEVETIKAWVKNAEQRELDLFAAAAAASSTEDPPATP